MRTSRWICAALILTASLSVTACTPAPPVRPETPVPTPTETAAADPAPAPESVFDLDCADLGSADEVAALFPTPVEPLAEPTPDGNTLARIWSGYAVQQLGGLACVWGDGTSTFPEPGVPDPEARALQIQALPGAADGWAKYSSIYADGATRSENCQSTFYCSIESLVGDVWIEVVASNPDDLAAATALHESVASTIAAAARTDLSWEAPADGIAPPAPCEGVLGPEELATAVEWPRSLNPERPHGGWSLVATTWEMLGTEPCTYTVGYADSGVGFLDWLPGGEWAWPLGAAEGTDIPLADPVDRDSASLSCEETTCTLDVLVAGSWIRMLLWDDLAETAPFADPPFEYTPAKSTEQMAADVAAAIVANIRN